MNGGFSEGTLLRGLASAIVVAAAALPAAAADLGGNCCADLEERVAELEATTVTKGNRKVSLTIYGQVNQGLIYWNDGAESNVYSVTNDNARSRFGFKGKAKISDDWEAGYVLEIGVRSANSKRFTQEHDRFTSETDWGLDLRDSYWFLKSKTLGTVSVGNQATATDAITEINQTQTKDFSKFSDVEDSGLGLFLRTTSGQLSSGGPASLDAKTGKIKRNEAITWRRLIGDGGDQPGDGERRFNAVKYDSPSFAGFAVSAAWGEDDYWDVALRYAGDIGAFKVAAGIGYGEITDNVQTQTVCSAALKAGNALGKDADCSQLGGSISVIHDPTGLFVNFGAGVKTDDIIDNAPVFAGTNVGDDQTFWAIQAGIEKKLIDYGKTTIYGEYYDYEGGGNTRRTIDKADAINPFLGASDGALWSTGVRMYGVGLAQGFDAAALVLYLSYRHYEADVTAARIVGGVADQNDLSTAQLEDLDVVFSGGVIKF